MQTATNEFKNNIKNGCPLYGSCKIVLADGTVLTPSKDDFFMDSSGFRIVRSVSSSSSFDIGTVTAAELDLKLINYDGHLNDYDFENAKIESVNVNMEKSDGTIESIPKGVFYVDTQDFNGGIVTLVAYDKLADMDKPYSGNKSGTVKALITAIADKYGIVLSNSDFNNSDFVVAIPSDDTFEYTDREILSYLCQVTCNYAYIDVKGYLVIAWYDDTETYNVIDAQSFKNPSTDLVSAGDFADMENKDIISAGLFTDINKLQLIDTVFSTSNIAVSDVLITGIKVIDNDGNEYSAGEEGYVLTIESNPFINSNNAQEIANRVWQVAEYTKFRPMTVSILPNPLLDVGDCVYILIKDNYYETVITNISFAIGQFTDLTIGAESPSKNASYNSKVSAVTKKAINQSANKVSALSSQFANLITQSLGMFEIHETQADGSIITYLANKPTLAESFGGTVWRMALDIFTVTSNYQGEATVWESGFDSQGNLKANVLEVVGITADWIKAGTIEGNVIAKNLDMQGGSINIETSSDTDDRIMLKRSSPEGFNRGISISPKQLVMETEAWRSTTTISLVWNGTVTSQITSSDSSIERRSVFSWGNVAVTDELNNTGVEIDASGKISATGDISAGGLVYSGGNPVAMSGNGHRVTFSWDGAHLHCIVDDTDVGVII